MKEKLQQEKIMECTALNIPLNLKKNMSKTKKEKGSGSGKQNSQFDPTIYKFYNLVSN